MIAPDDVKYRLWADGSESYTVYCGEDDMLAIVTRDPVTHDLHCHRCHVSARHACEHIIAAMAKAHSKPGDR
jgi:hypothetical protein